MDHHGASHRAAPSGSCRNYEYGYQYFLGTIDELAIYTRALSADDILDIYNAGSEGKCKTPGTPSVDTTPPVLTLPANITTNAVSPSGAPVSYIATATDLVDGPRPVSCAPPLGCDADGARGRPAARTHFCTDGCGELRLPRPFGTMVSWPTRC